MRREAEGRTTGARGRRADRRGARGGRRGVRDLHRREPGVRGERGDPPCALYEPLDIGWLEEPLPADDIEGHARLSRSTTIPIAIGESIYSPLHFRDHLQRGACSIVQVDVGRIGGITPWLKVAHMAECFNVAVCPHFLMELHVSFCVGVPNARWVEYIPQLEEITVEGMRIVDGQAVPSEAPELGIAWDWEAIEGRKLAAGSVR